MTAPTFALADDGEHVEITHACSAAWYRPSKEVLAVLPLGPNGWQVVSREPLTVTPSVLCEGCGLHGFITDGAWRSV